MKKKIALNEMKKIEFNMLDYFSNFCKENKLRFYLIGGTLLGAVRHKGFIPWDDDIDIVMPRDDYEKAIRFFNESMHSRYKLFSIENKDDYIYTYGKLIDSYTSLKENIKSNVNGLGVYIDIFPIDGVPNNLILRKIHYYRIYILRRLLYLTYYYNFKNENVFLRVAKKIFVIIANKIGKSKILNNIIKIAKKYKFDNCDMIGVITAGYGQKEIMPRNIYNETVYLEFEGEKFPAPGKYEEYLTRIYGDYMKLPPEEERVTHHEYEVYWNTNIEE